MMGREVAGLWRKVNAAMGLFLWKVVQVAIARSRRARAGGIAAICNPVNT